MCGGLGVWECRVVGRLGSWSPRVKSYGQCRVWQCSIARALTGSGFSGAAQGFGGAGALSRARGV